MKKTLGCMVLLSVMMTPNAWADNIADCEVLIAETVKDEDTNGSALVSSYRPAGAFLSSVYDDEPGHVETVDGHKIRALFCQRRSAIPTLRDFPILETGVAFSLSQDFDSADSDLTLTRFIDGAFKTTYSGPGLDVKEQAQLDDTLEVFNFQPHSLGLKNEDISDETTSEEDVENVDDVADDITGKDDAIAVVSDVEKILESGPAEEDESVELVSNPEPSEDAPEVPLPSPETETITTNVPTADEAVQFDATCQLVTRDTFGVVNETPLSAAGLQNNLETAPAFIMPVPTGVKMEAVKCARDSLIPGENDYKVARAGYPFFYFVEMEDGQRAAALEFVGGKYRMNLLEGDFTEQELIDAKARILSFNANISSKDSVEGSSE